MKIKKGISISLVVVSVIVWLTLISTVLFMGSANYGGVQTGIAGIILSLVPMYAVYLLIAKKKLSWMFLAMLLIVCVAVLAGLVIFLFGYLNDLNGEACTGFFGARTTCVSNAQLNILMTFYNPFFIGSAVTLSVISLIIQATRKTN